MENRYYGWYGSGGYDSVVKIVNYSEAYVFNRQVNEFRRNDDFLKAMFDPGSDFEQITEEEANDLIEEWTK